MFGTIIRVALLLLLMFLYANNIIDNIDNWYGAVVYNRINFLILLAILYIISTFIKEFQPLFMLILIGGLIFHGYMYYKVYTQTNTGQEFSTEAPKQKKCSGEGVTWYTKLNNSCY